MCVQPDLSRFDGLPAAEVINALHIEGTLRSAFRGKELVLSIDRVSLFCQCNLSTHRYYPLLSLKFIFRICYSLEAHSFWVPTMVYDDIVSERPVRRGEKSWTYNIPSQYWNQGIKTVQGQISIQAAFRCWDWTLLFVDHNVMITFHVMALKKPCKVEDLRPDSKVAIHQMSVVISHLLTQLWGSIWSSTHGPSLVFETSLASLSLLEWRRSAIQKKNMTPIFAAVKATQTVFNGYGAQETCDMLIYALLSPAMPAYAICCDSELWTRFEKTIFDYQKKRLELATARPVVLPYVSGIHPFRFNVDGHNRFLAHVLGYKRSHVKVDKSLLEQMLAMNLLNPSAIIQNNGIGRSKYC